MLKKKRMRTNGQGVDINISNGRETENDWHKLKQHIQRRQELPLFNHKSKIPNQLCPQRPASTLKKLDDKFTRITLLTIKTKMEKSSFLNSLAFSLLRSIDVGFIEFN